MHPKAWRSAPLATAIALMLAVQPVTAVARDAAPPASDAAASADVPWLYKGSDVPVDREWLFGVLPNGLRYAVRRNGVPPGQVSIRIRIDAGSLMEQEHERGFAHLLEHLTFRQSRYVPEGEAIRVWQRFGATFGSDSNAETTPTQTVYKLDLPNAASAGLDESIKILSGMIREPALSEGNVRAEVPIVLAEQRERAGPQARLGDATREHFFQGQLLADRTPIGTTATLTAATAETVRGFHSRWYRPDTTVISIAGDADPQFLADLVARHFGDWQAAGSPPQMPDFGTPKPGGQLARTLVEPSLPHLVNLAYLRPWVQVDDTIAYNQGVLTDLLAIQLINRRLEARARAGGSFLQASVNQEDVSRSVDGTFVSVVPLESDWKAALADVRAVIADAIARPPSREEIARELAEFDAALAVGAEGARTQAGSKLADDIVRAVDIRETVAAPDVALSVLRDMTGMLTPERLLAATRKLFEGDATRAILVSPSPVADGEAALAQAVTAPVKAAGDARLAASNLRFEDLPAIGRPGAVAETQPLGVLEMERLRFANGVTAILYPNDGEAAKVMVKVRFGKGAQAIRPEDGAMIWAGEAALVQGGFGKVDLEGLDRLTNGRRMGLKFEVEDDHFALSYDTRPADLADQLYLMAAKLARPRWDERPVLRAVAGGKLAYESYAMSPQSVLERDLQWLLHGRDDRWKLPSPADLDAITPARFRAVWEPLLATGPVEVLVFGDFERAEAVAALERTFGALPDRAAPVVPPGAGTIRFPETGGAPLRLTHRGDADQAAAVIAWPTGGGRADIRTSRQLEVLAQLFNQRLFDRLRDQAGASYAPQVRNEWPLEFAQGGHVAAISVVQPEAVDRFFTITREIAADLVANPVSADELSRITEPLRQLISRASTANGFWLQQVEGSGSEPERLLQLRSLLGDYTAVTAADIQSLATRFLKPDGAWQLEVLPEAEAAAGR